MKIIAIVIEFAVEIIPVIPYIGVAFPFMGLLTLDHYHFYFLMIFKETLTFLSLSNLVLQYLQYRRYIHLSKSLILEIM